MPNNINFLQPKVSTSGGKFEEFEKNFEEERRAFFSCLTKEQQLLVFCEVVNKLVKAELLDKVSYRGVLYGEFEFASDAYTKAQMSGFLELHNSIDSEKVDLGEFGSALLKLYGIEQNKEHVLEKINSFHEEGNEN